MTKTSALKRPLMLAAAAIGLLQATPGLAADVILINGRIYTAADSGKWAEALAITNDTIDKTGTTAEVMKEKTANTQVIDLKGRMVIPGITDNHVHLWFGSLALSGFNLSTPDSVITPEDHKDLFIAKVKEHAAANPDLPILFGRASFSRGTPDPGPSNAILDAAVPDRPLIVHHTSEHALWVNSKALELAGITNKPLADPDIEKYVERDATGKPTGLLREAAMAVMEQALPQMPMEQQVKMLAAGQQYMNSFGVTSAVLLTGGLAELEAYGELRKRGLLTMRIRQGFASVSVNHDLNPQFLADLQTARTRFNDDWLSANIVKFFMDGAPTPPLYDANTYTHIIQELDRLGYQITSHALSPEGVQMALDGYESIINTNGKRDRRLRIEHGMRVNQSDLPRFNALDIVISTQPAFCCGVNTGTPTSQWNSFNKSGATLVFSSDWPCSWPPSPMVGIEQATMRYVRRPVTPHGPVGDVTTDGQDGERITAEQALLAYTRDAAYANLTDTKLGTLEAGKLADLVILSQNILEAPKEAIGATKVLTTMVGGKVVYGAFPQ